MEVGSRVVMFFFLLGGWNTILLLGEAYLQGLCQFQGRYLQVVVSCLFLNMHPNHRVY